MRWRCGSFDIESESPPHHLHRSATGFVSAKAQSRILAYLDPELTEEERDIVRQGRNAKSGDIPKMPTSSNTGMQRHLRRWLGIYIIRVSRTGSVSS